MNRRYLQTYHYRMEDYVDFILNDENSVEKQKILLQITRLQTIYKANGLKSVIYPNENYKFSEQSSVDWNFEVYLMKKAILQNTTYLVNFKVTPVLTRQANKVLLLAMIKGNVLIVKYFLTNRLFNINDSIFGSKYFPSYFLLACACSNEIYDLFLNEFCNYSISWAGLTPTILCACTNKELDKCNDFDFITYQEYRLLNKFRDVELINAEKNYPLFSIDFLCMNRKTQALRNLLEKVPEIGDLSRLSFIVQNHDHFVLILTRYGFKERQEFNGMTPLHINAINGSFLTMIYLMYTGCLVIENNYNEFPDDVVDESIREQTLRLFEICTKKVYYSNKYHRNVKMIYFSIFSDKHKEFKSLVERSNDKSTNIWSVFKYLKYNNENQIKVSSRFAITSLFSKNKTATQTEQEVVRLLNKFENIPVLSTDAAIKERYITIMHKNSK